MVFVDDKAIAINALIEAVEAIEQELGITPSGVYADVRVRLDILEARINNPFAPAPNVENPFFIGNDGVSISTGSGYPTENRLSGSLYLRKDGYNQEGLYARRPDGYWHGIDTDPFTANGDLSGTIYSQTVIGLQNRPVSPAAPETDSAGDGYVLTWNNVANWWEPQIGFFAAGDLDGYKLTQTVVNLQGSPIVIGTMDATRDGYSLIWNDSATNWEPQRLAVVFDPLNDGTTTNIRSNRYDTQSPIDPISVGAVNFGNNSLGIAPGIQGSYSSILGGDEHAISANYSIIGCGSDNIIADGGGFIGNGFANVINVGGIVGAIVNGDNNTLNTSVHSFIGNGNFNSITGTQSAIVNGFSNSINGNDSFIGTGPSNNIESAVSAIVVGSSNSINPNSNFSFIGGGQLNAITGLQSVILGGLGNVIDAAHSSIIIGQNNSITGGAQSNILSGNFNVILATDSGSFLNILGGSQNQLEGTFNTIINGLSNSATALSSYSNIVNGTLHQIDGYYNTILSGSNNNIDGEHSVILNGVDNTISSDFVLMAGANNTSNSGSDYAFVNGVFNDTSSQYVTISGDNNSIDVSSDYVIISGSSNTIPSSAGNSAIFGNGNVLDVSSEASFIKGNINQITGFNSGIFGSSNILFGEESYIFGSSGLVGTLSVPVNNSFIFGTVGKSLYSGQIVQSAHSINGSNGASQFSRVILDGSQVSGGAFTLNIAGATNLILENGKSYDMCIRVLITNTTGSPTCARYVYDVLAHCESGILTLDVVNATILNDNSTGWTVSLLTSTNQLVVQVDSSGVLNRRAIATVEWREISRT